MFNRLRHFRTEWGTLTTTGTILLIVSWVSAAAGAQDPVQKLRDWSGAGQIGAVRQLLEENSELDIDSQDESGWTALMLASRAGYVDVVRLLLDSGANPRLENDNKETALLLAATQGRTEVVRLLLDTGVDFDTPDVNGRTPLFRAIENRHAEVIELLQAAAQKASASRVRVIQEIDSQEETIPPVIVESEPARYTESAREQGIEGTVVLMVLVRRDGSIGGISVSESLEESLDESAVRTVRRWKFEPATRGGKRVNVVVEIPVEFKAPDKP